MDPNIIIYKAVLKHIKSIPENIDFDYKTRNYKEIISCDRESGWYDVKIRFLKVLQILNRKSRIIYNSDGDPVLQVNGKNINCKIISNSKQYHNDCYFHINIYIGVKFNVEPDTFYETKDKQKNPFFIYTYSKDRVKYFLLYYSLLEFKNECRIVPEDLVKIIYEYIFF